LKTNPNLKITLLITPSSFLNSNDQYPYGQEFPTAGGELLCPEDFPLDVATCLCAYGFPPRSIPSSEFSQPPPEEIQMDTNGGTPKDEVVIGTEVGDIILGLGGINNMRGNGDANVIFGNALYGGKGDDHLLGSSDSDVLDGRPGHDAFDCGECVDRIVDFNLKGNTASTNCELFR